MQQLAPTSGEFDDAAAVTILGLLVLGGCAAEARLMDEPAIYLNMAEVGAKLDPVVAASMISLYRQNNGLGVVVVDPALMTLAESHRWPWRAATSSITT